jgi:hypothetical protein
MGSKCRNTPVDIQRQLRREANFGCARCGSPILDNAHIIPYRKTHAFSPDDMLALCPTCHRIADTGHYSERYLRELKANPHNKIKVGERFLIEGKDLILNMIGNRYINCNRILAINNFDLITMKRESENYILLNLNLYDRSHKLLGIIHENNWTVETSDLWDVEYKSQHLTIRNSPKEILFEAKIENGEVFISGILYFYGHAINILKDGLRMDDKNFKLTMIGCTIEESEPALELRL